MKYSHQRQIMLPVVARTKFHARSPGTKSRLNNINILVPHCLLLHQLTWQIHYQATIKLISHDKLGAYTVEYHITTSGITLEKHFQTPCSYHSSCCSFKLIFLSYNSYKEQHTHQSSCHNESVKRQMQATKYHVPLHLTEKSSNQVQSNSFFCELEQKVQGFTYFAQACECNVRKEKTRVRMNEMMITIKSTISSHL